MFVKRIVLQFSLVCCALSVAPVAHAKDMTGEHSALLQSLESTYESLNTVLAKIKDAETAKQHNKEFQQLRLRMNQMLDKVSRLPPLPNEAQAGLASQSGNLETLTTQINFHMERIGQNPSIKQQLHMP